MPTCTMVQWSVGQQYLNSKVVSVSIMYVYLRHNDKDPYQHLHHCRHYLQQQQQQNLPATATERTSLYRMSSYNQHQHQQPLSVSTYPCLDYCNAVLPAYSWHQLSNRTTSTSQTNGCCSQQTMSSSSGVTSRSSVSTMCLNSSRWSVPGYHELPEVHRDAASSWCMDDQLNAPRQVNAVDSYPLLSIRSQAPTYCQYDQPVSQYSDIHKFHTSQSSSSSSSSPSQSQAAGEPVDAAKTTQSSDTVHGYQRRTKDALVPLIIRAILSASDVRLSLADICRYIQQNSVDYAKSDEDSRWHNNVRHTLSHYEFFVKCGRVPTGRGNYWTVHPVCRPAFAADDLRIKRARHAVQLYEKSISVKSTSYHRRPLH